MSKHGPEYLSAHSTNMLEVHVRVGPEKPVSYLPIYTIEKVLGLRVEEYISLIECNGGRSSMFTSQICCIKSGAVYAYSYEDLKAILEYNRDALIRHGWPVSCGRFIERIAYAWLENDNPIMPIIKSAFGESNGPQRE